LRRTDAFSCSQAPVTVWFLITHGGCIAAQKRLQAGGQYLAPNEV